MDFDEYEYLEKTVENPDLPSRERDSANRNGVESEKERSQSSKHGTEESERNSDRHRSKRSRSEDRERSSSRRRSRSREDRHRRDKDRDKEERNEKDRVGNRDREREKRREREREIEKERERSRRSRSRSYRDDVRDRREKSRERELKERERELRARDRDGRRYRDKKEEVAEPEADPERDQRTVFAYQISLKADERDVYEFFSRAGKVRDVRLIMDRNSRRSKGVGYIEFYDAMSVPMAIALSGQPLRGQAVMVKPSEAEKNLVQSTSAAGAGGAIGPYSGGARRLYVGNLHFNITEDQLRQDFDMASSSSSSSRRKPTNPGPITINVADGTPSGHYYHGFITRISSHVTHVDEFPPTQTWSQHKKAGRVEALYRDLTDAYSLPSWNDGSEMAQKFRTWFNDSARHKWNDHKNRSLRRTYDLCKGDVTQASGHQPSTVDTDTWNSLLSTYSQNHIVDESGFSKSAKCKASRSCNELDHRLGRESLGSWKGKFRRSRGRDPQAVEIFSKEFTKQDPLLASPGNLPPPHMRGKPVSERNIEIGARCVKMAASFNVRAIWIHLHES